MCLSIDYRWPGVVVVKERLVFGRIQVFLILYKKYCDF